MDEFSEFHLKELAVRDDLGGLVPSAGVGTAFDRESFERIAGVSQEPFDATNLTEDYDIALRLRLAGKGLHFACHSVDVRGEDGEVREEYIATREYFPHGAGASVRQRARWICGIALQAWERFGWQGPAPVRYSLWRDRKGVLNGILILCAYLLVAYLAARCTVAEWIGTPWCLAQVIPPGSWLELLLQVNFAGLAWRSVAKFHFVRTLYGWKHGILAVPRLVIANLVVIAATFRALRLYARHRILDEPLRWAKTDHSFPTVDALGVEARADGAVVVAATAAEATEAVAVAAELLREAARAAPPEVATETPVPTPTPTPLPLPTRRSEEDAVVTMSASARDRDA
jgi:adsorption protein B